MLLLAKPELQKFQRPFLPPPTRRLEYITDNLLKTAAA
jgi:hypothetical protein